MIITLLLHFYHCTFYFIRFLIVQKIMHFISSRINIYGVVST